IEGRKGALHKMPKHGREDSGANRHARRRADGRTRALPRLEAARTGRAAHIEEFAAWSQPLLSESSSETRRAEAPQGGRIPVIHYRARTPVSFPNSASQSRTAES